MKIKTERETLYVMVLGLTFFWALTATALAVARKRETLVFIQDEAGIHSLDNKSEEMKKREMLLLTQSFLKNFYSYDSGNFKDQILSAKNYLSPGLWEKHLKEFDELNEHLKKTRLSQEVNIESVARNDGKIEALILLNIRTDLEVVAKKIKLTLRFEDHERSPGNPYQYEINDYEESTIN